MTFAFGDGAVNEWESRNARMFGNMFVKCGDHHFETNYSMQSLQAAPIDGWLRFHRGVWLASMQVWCVVVIVGTVIVDCEAIACKANVWLDFLWGFRQMLYVVMLVWRLLSYRMLSVRDAVP